MSSMKQKILLNKERIIKMKKIKKMLLLGCLLTPFVQSATSCSSYDLVVFNWGEYIDNNVIYAFEDKYGVSVKYLTFDSNESMMQKLSGGARYDVVFPSDYAVEEMASKDLIEELDYSKFEYYKGEEDLVDLLKDSIEELKNGGTCVGKDGNPTVSCTLNEFNQNQDKYSSYKEGFDMLKYAIPYTFGQTGILYNKNKVSLEELETLGYDVLKQDKNTDGTTRRVVVYDAGKDVFSMALLANGYDIQYEDTQGTDKASAWLEDLLNKKADNFAIKADELLDDVPNGKHDVAFTYSGDAIYVIDATTERDEDGNVTKQSDWDFYIPKAKEGAPSRTNIYCDAMVITKDCPNKDLAYKFIDFMSSHDASYLNTSYIGYTTARKDVYEEIISTDRNFQCIHHDVEELDNYADLYDEGTFHKAGYFSHVPTYRLVDKYSDNVPDKFYRYDEAYKKKIEQLWTEIVLQS